jgi:chloramphenicol-sensitive protein RarD
MTDTTRFDPDADRREKRRGVVNGLGAYLAWGFLPLYFKAVETVPSLEVLAHRVVWSLLFLVIVVQVRGQWSGFKPLFKSARIQVTLMVTTVLIATNWGVFIWAVANGRLVEASLGYFVTPLVSVLLGFVFLRERLRRWQTVAVVMAAAGIVTMTLRIGHPPLISIVLAVSFGFYGLLRKQIPATGVQGLTAETLMLAPVAVGWLIWRARVGDLVFLHTTLSMNLLLLSAGVLTAMPLIWFAEGARRLRLATLGFLQYLAPTGQLLLAVAYFGEPFTRDHLMSFGLIWLALALYSFDTFRSMRTQGRAA